MAKKEVLEMEIKSNTKGVTKDVDKLGTSTEKAKGGFKSSRNWLSCSWLYGFERSSRKKSESNEYGE